MSDDPVITENTPATSGVNDKGLLGLGVGGGSKNERLKASSDYLRGPIASDLADGTPRFSEDSVQLLKFHGSYQQEDRDKRLVIHKDGGAKAYQMMLRTRIPGGEMSAAQYLAHDAIADRYASGTLRITTRQGIQLHGILKSNLRATIQDINATLLTTLGACGDVNRNVMACPAPVTTRAQAQVERVAHDIATRLAPRSRAYADLWIDGEKLEAEEPETEPLYGPTYLPRKFKVGVAFPGDNCVDIYTQDIGLVAELNGAELAGFTLLIGGGMGMTHGKTETHPRLALPFAFVTPAEALEVVETIVTIQRDYGDRQNRKHARMKYLVEERGVDWFREETQRRLGRALAAPRPIAWEGVHDHLGWHKQDGENWYLGLYIENGRIKDTAKVRLRSGLRAVIERFQPGVRLTGQQNILLTDIPYTRRSAVQALLKEYGVAVTPQRAGVRRFAMACPALPTCGLALAEAERALPDLVTAIEADLRALGMRGEKLSVRMTGCPNGCARPYMGDIGIVGRSKDLYNLYIGGDWANTRMNTLYADSVRIGDITATIHPLLALWRDERRPGETFGDYTNRVGVAALRARVAAGETPVGAAG